MNHEGQRAPSTAKVNLDAVFKNQAGFGFLCAPRAFVVQIVFA
jgi:hypothetical protein